MFLFQGSGYRFRKPVDVILLGTCIGSIAGICMPDRIYAGLYGLQFGERALLFVYHHRSLETGCVCVKKRMEMYPVFCCSYWDIVFHLFHYNGRY